MADETERECARLFRVNRTIHELVKDRVSPSSSSFISPNFKLMREERIGSDSNT